LDHESREYLNQNPFLRLDRSLAVISYDLLARAPNKLLRVRGVVSLVTRIVTLTEDQQNVEITKNVTTDPVAGVRRVNLHFLLNNTFPEHLRDEALESAIKDPAMEVRIEAAIALGSVGDEAVADLLLRPECPYQDREAGLHHLTNARPTLATRTAMELLDVDDSSPNILLILSVLASVGTDTEHDTVVRLADRWSSDAEVQAIAFKALGRTGSAEDVPRLITALEHRKKPVVHEALAALATLGTIKVVPDILNRMPRLRGRELKRQARATVVAIQERCDAGEPGRIAVVHDRVGAVAVVKDVGDNGGLS